MWSSSPSVSRGILVQGRKLLTLIVILPALVAGWYLMERGKHRKPSAGAVSQSTMAEASLAATDPAGSPTFDIAHVDGAGRAVISGHAPARAKVTLLVGQAEAGDGLANSRGEWVILLNRQLGAGTQVVTARAQVANEPPRLSVQRIIAVGRSNEPLLVLERPGRASRILEQPDESPVEVGLDIADYEPDGQVFLSGHAKPKSDVRLYLNNLASGFALADEQGFWVQRVAGISQGVFTLRLDELDAKGGVSARTELPFERLNVAVAAKTLPAKANLASSRDHSGWLLASRLAGTGIHFAIIYTANQARPRDPSLVYPGQIFEQGEASVE